MTREEAIAIIENEKECVKRACDRDCYNCELVKTDTEILAALEMAIKALEQEPCDDAISRQAVLDALRARFGGDFDWGKWWNSTHVLAAIESVPSVKPQEPKVGHWVRDTITDLYHCSECRYICRQDPRSKDYYCGYCGARMEESEDKA